MTVKKKSALDTSGYAWSENNLLAPWYYFVGPWGQWEIKSLKQFEREGGPKSAHPLCDLHKSWMPANSYSHAKYAILETLQLRKFAMGQSIREIKFTKKEVDIESYKSKR